MANTTGGGQYPPNGSMFYTDTTSTIDYTGALQWSGSCPVGGAKAQQVTVNGGTVSGGTEPFDGNPASLFQLARQAQEDGEYKLAVATYRYLLQDTISSAQKEVVLMQLFNMFSDMSRHHDHSRPCKLHQVRWRGPTKN